MKKIKELFEKFEDRKVDIALWLEDMYDFAFGSGIKWIGIHMWDEFFVETVLLFTTLLLTITVGILALLQEKKKKKKKTRIRYYLRIKKK